MKSKLKRVVALSLAVITCLSITACSKAQSQNEKWDISAADYKNAEIAEVTSDRDNGKRHITLTSENTKFKSEVKEDSIRIIARPFSKSDIQKLNTDDTANDSLNEAVVCGVSVERRNEKTLVLSFKEPKYDYCCMYMIYVHKEAVGGNRFVIGIYNVRLNKGKMKD